MSSNGWTAEDEGAILDSIRTWVDKEVRPMARHFDQADEYPHALVEQMKELGLFGATIGPEWGGLGLSARTYAKIVIEVASAWMAPSGIFNSHLIMAGAIERFGTPEQKAEWLPRMASGEFRGGIGLTEPNAGSDLQAIRTVATREGEDYRINGAKTWITNSGQGHGILLLVKTDPRAQPRHKGMSLFIAEKGEGFIVAKKMKKLGYKAIDTCELVFDQYRVPASRLVGGEEGKGFAQIAGGLELGRINVAARGCGIGLGALQMATRYAQERQAFGKAIWEHQAIQLKLAEMATRVEASRLLIDQAAARYDAGERCDLEAAMAKFHGSETGVFCANEAMRIHGGYSYSLEYEIERFYRDSMLMCIGEGTNEILQTIIAKQWIARHPV
ncbi:MAG: acyl-CoA dehydrogenase family protein [Rubrivivax sp.]|nr:acyl-CoA dehydrogenase family protein [Rubrivivax sp.]